MWRSKKNRLFMILSFGFILIYTLILLPNISGPNEVDVEALERDMYANQQQFEDRLESGMTAPSVMTGTNIYEVAHNEFVAQRDLLTALKQGDIYRYLDISYRPSQEEAQSTVADNTFGEFNFNILGTHLEEPFESLKNQFYRTEIEGLTFHTVHNRTSMQQLHLFFLGLGPTLILLSTIFFISDITVKDRNLKTQKIGQPLKWPVYLFVQSMAALSYVLLFFAVLTGLFITLNGFLHSFGELSLPIGYFETILSEGKALEGVRILKSIGWFFMVSIPFMVLLLYLVTRLNTLFSLLVKHPVIVMILGMFMVVFQAFYYGEETTELLGVHLTWFPQTYTRVGEVVTGRLEYQLAEAIPELFLRGLLVLSVTILVVEMSILLASKRITRQKFIG